MGHFQHEHCGITPLNYNVEAGSVKSVTQNFIKEENAILKPLRKVYMTVLSWMADGSNIVGEISTAIQLYPIGGGDYKIGFIADINLDIADIPIPVGQQLLNVFMICRHTFVCNVTNVNISASKLCLSPLTLGSYCLESYGYKKNPGFLNYLYQELISTVSFSTRDELGDYLGDASFPYGYDSVPVSGTIADTIYFRFDGANPDGCTHQVQYLVRRNLVPIGAYNNTYFSYDSTGY